MSRKEEKLTAIQNVGATTFAIGAIGCCMAGNPLTLMVCAGAMAVGAVIVFIGGVMLDKLYEKEGEREDGRTRKKAS
jgi:hypothetical protein